MHCKDDGREGHGIDPGACMALTVKPSALSASSASISGIDGGLDPVFGSGRSVAAGEHGAGEYCFPRGDFGPNCGTSVFAAIRLVLGDAFWTRPSRRTVVAEIADPAEIFRADCVGRPFRGDQRVGLEIPSGNGEATFSGLKRPGRRDPVHGARCQGEAGTSHVSTTTSGHGDHLENSTSSASRTTSLASRTPVMNAVVAECQHRIEGAAGKCRSSLSTLKA